MRTIEETVAIRLSGRIDVSTVSSCRDLLQAALDETGGTLVVDLGGVDLIDLTGLGMLVAAQHRARRGGRDIVLRNVPPRVTRLLRATRLDRVLHVERPGVSTVA